MKTALRSSRRSTVSQRLKRGLALNTPISYSYSGAPVSITVPTGAKSMTVDLKGAAGGGATRPGLGGRLQATIPVTEGEVLELRVGGQGLVSNGDIAQAPNVGGYNGGGALTPTGYIAGTGGGGCTDLRKSTPTLSDDFSEADNTDVVNKLPDIGSVAWAKTIFGSLNPTIKVVGGKAKAISWSSPGEGSVFLTTDATISDFDYKLSFAGAAGDSGVVVHETAAGSGNGLIWLNNGHLLRANVPASSYVDIATVTPAYTVGQALEVRSRGNRLVFLIDGVISGSYLLTGGDITTYANKTRVGFYLGSGNIVTSLEGVNVYRPPMLIAGGGGGEGGLDGQGGHGGGTTGANGTSSNAGYQGSGGSQSSGGAGGDNAIGYTGESGILGQGGKGRYREGGGPGGGGGGYYGGGGGVDRYSFQQGGGGGGGSSYADPTAVDVVHTQGHRSGNGAATITFLPNPPVTILSESTWGSQAITEPVLPSITVQAGKLVVVAVTVASTAVNDYTLSGGGITWTQRAKMLSDASPGRFVTWIWTGVSATDQTFTPTVTRSSGTGNANTGAYKIFQVTGVSTVAKVATGNSFAGTTVSANLAPLVNATDSSLVIAVTQESSGSLTLSNVTSVGSTMAVTGPSEDYEVRLISGITAGGVTSSTATQNASNEGRNIAMLELAV